MESDTPPIPHRPLSAGGHFADQRGVSPNELFPLDLNLNCL